MYENQENQEPRAFTYEELEAKCVELEGRVNNERERATSYMQQASRLLGKIQAVEEYLDEAWVDDLSGEADDIITEICNKLDISLETEKTFTVSVDFTVTIKANRNFDFDSVDENDFEADIRKSGYVDWTMEEDDYSIQSVTQD